MGMDERQYTPEEADALLPDLTERLSRVREARQVILANGEPIRRGASMNGGGKKGTEYWQALRTLRQEVEHLAELGIVLRDPESGLIDFPAARDGREVFLCWRVGEERVAWWHGPESGFAGRRPL
jgi:hypothetical protein